MSEKYDNPETRLEAAVETRLEIVSEAGLETGMEAGLEAGMETGLEAGMEAGVEAGLETGVEDGLEAGQAVLGPQVGAVCSSQRMTFDPNLFDDEGADSDVSRDNGDDIHTADGDCSDTDESEPEDKPRKLNPKFIKAGGAARKSSLAGKPRRQRSSTGELKSIASESQRHAREGRVNIPYHQPKALDLKGILTKNKRKLARLNVPDCGDSHRVDFGSSPNTVTSVQTSRKTSEYTNADTFRNGDIVINKTEQCFNGDEQSKDQLIRRSSTDFPCAAISSPANTGCSVYVSPSKSTVRCDVGRSVSMTGELYCTSDVIKGTPDNTVRDSITAGLPKTSLTPKLASLDLSMTPRLTGAPDSVIEFNGCQDESVIDHSGLDKLKERLLEHSSKRPGKHRREKEISVVIKQTGNRTNQEELCLSKVTVQIASDDDERDAPSTRPGAKLRLIKERLQETMTRKRQQARAERIQLYELDNEEGFQDDEEDFEDELTDETTDSDLDTDESMRNSEELKGVNAPDHKVGRGHFEEDRAGSVADDEEFSGFSTNGVNSTGLSFKAVLHKSRTLDLFDDDLSSQLLPPSKNESAKPVTADKRAFRAFLPSHAEDSMSTVWAKDLVRPGNHLGNDVDSNARNVFDDCQRTTSEKSLSIRHNSLDLSLDYESQSQLLDSDGLLKPTNPKKTRQFSSTSYNSQGNMAELLGICSGQFLSSSDVATGQQTGQFCTTSSKTDWPTDMNELLGLCSGQFVGDPKSNIEESTGSVTSDQESSAFVLMSDEDISDDENPQGDSDEHSQDADLRPSQEAEGRQYKRKVSEFFEDEAELSGSEYASDEDSDGQEGDDILEVEEGDLDTSVADEDTLRNQVGRVHLKSMMDKDSKEIALMKEMYLQDGDLHSEGQGRMRRFRWMNQEGDNNIEPRLFEASCEDDDDAVNDEETKWRLERFRREKWLEEKEALEGENDDSQFVKFGKAAFKQKSKRGICEPSAFSRMEENALNTPKLLPKVKTLGSFLRKDSRQLSKIAETLKPLDVVASGPKKSSNFVFTALSPTSSRHRKPANKHARVWKTDETNAATSLPQPKRQRLSNNSPAFSSQNSIFHLMTESQ